MSGGSLPPPEELGRTLVVHHWDADGIASASLALEYLGDQAELYVPPLGFYFLPSREVDFLSRLGKFNSLMVLDMSMTVDSIRDAAAAVGAEKVVLVDHHVREADELPSEWVSLINTSQPATSWHVTRLLRMEPDVRSVVGVAGDLGPTLRERPIFREIKPVLSKSGLTLDELLRLAKLLDSSYRVGDRGGVREAVLILTERRREPRALLEEADWIDKLRSAEEELERVLREARVEYFGDLVYAEFESSHMLISSVGRRLAWCRERAAVLVLNKRWREGYAQMYARVKGVDVDLTGLVRLANEAGYQAGGKRESMGVILPSADAEGFARTALEWLRGRLGR